MDQDNSPAEEIQHLARLIHGIKVAMLTTVCADGSLHSRPMATQESLFDGTLWFFTSADSPWVGDLEQSRRVNVSYANSNEHRYVSISGQATLVRDEQKIKELWNPLYTVWFPKGLTDPQLALVRVDADSAAFWDSQSNSMTRLADLARALAAGKSYQPGDHHKIDLSETRSQQQTANTN